MRKLAAFGISLAAIGLATTPAMAADANGNHAAYTWVVATDTAKAPDGSTITMFGVGNLTAGPGSTTTTFVGSFTNSAGVSGSWAATGVESFVSYGSAGPGFPPGATGGEAKLSVSLSNGQTGVLTIICVLGSPPPSKMEGIQLVLGSGVSGAYTMQDGGFTIFFAT